MNCKSEKIIIGTAQFGLDYGIANNDGMMKHEELKKILSFCQENKIKWLDTAAAYGSSEERIGSFVKSNDVKNLNVISKYNCNVSLRSQLEQTIEKIGKYPKVVLAHSVNDYVNPDFQIDLFTIKNESKIEKVGVSVYNEKEIKTVLKSKIPDVVQCPLNILDTRLFRSGILKRLYNMGIEVHIRSVFLQGLFYMPKEYIKTRFSHAYEHILKLEKIAIREDVNIAELSLIWVNSLKEVSKVIIGVDRLSHLISHIDILRKSVDCKTIKEALDIQYENDKILNPSLWKIK